jgi:hypothetical protein
MHHLLNKVGNFFPFLAVAKQDGTLNIAYLLGILFFKKRQICFSFQRREIDSVLEFFLNFIPEFSFGKDGIDITINVGHFAFGLNFLGEFEFVEENNG